MYFTPEYNLLGQVQIVQEKITKTILEQNIILWTYM